MLLIVVVCFTLLVSFMNSILSQFQTKHARSLTYLSISDKKSHVRGFPKVKKLFTLVIASVNIGIDHKQHSTVNDMRLSSRNSGLARIW